MKPTFIAFCDLSLTAASYDFVTWLVHAMYQRDCTECGAMHVVLVPNEATETGLRDWGKHDAAATRWRFWHICMAAIPLAGTKVSVTLASSGEHARKLHDSYCLDRLGEACIWWPEGKQHFLGPLVEASRAGKSIPKLRATDAARRYVAEWFGKNEKIVTFTVRNQETDDDRNSDGTAMNKFDDWVLKTKGYQSVWLHDSHGELQYFEGNHVSISPDLRLALYERAQMNIISNNGPQELLKFSAAPYLVFLGDLSEGWRDHFKRYFSMSVGDQLPWARADQRLVYAQDSFENLCAEFEKWEAARGLGR